MYWLISLRIRYYTMRNKTGRSIRTSSFFLTHRTIVGTIFAIAVDSFHYYYHRTCSRQFRSDVKDRGTTNIILRATEKWRWSFCLWNVYYYPSGDKVVSLARIRAIYNKCKAYTTEFPLKIPERYNVDLFRGKNVASSRIYIFFVSLFLRFFISLFSLFLLYNMARPIVLLLDATKRRSPMFNIWRHIITVFVQVLSVFLLARINSAFFSLSIIFLGKLCTKKSHFSYIKFVISRDF